MSYNIHTLFGDTPERKHGDFVMGKPDDKIWAVVVQRSVNNFLMQTDRTLGLSLIEAITQANNLRGIYKVEGWVDEDGVLRKGNESVVVFVI